MNVRVQLSRRKGWKMPPNTVKVDRSTRWGNPFSSVDAGIAVASYRDMLSTHGAICPLPMPWPKGKVPLVWTTVDDVKRELRGKNLACWCKLDAPCHADVLLRLANQGASDGS